MEPRGSGSHLLVIQHDSDAPPALLADWASAAGIDLRIVRLDAGDDLPPTVSSVSGVVVLGSEQTAWDDTVEWLPAELVFVKRALCDEVPILGICFGGQVLARALGARLYRLEAPEIGWSMLQPAEEALPPGPWLSFHRDAFDLPPGAEAAGANSVCLQAFRLGSHLGVQFHPEVTPEIVAGWAAASKPPVVAPADDDPRWVAAADAAHRLFTDWFATAAARRS